MCRVLLQDFPRAEMIATSSLANIPTDSVQRHETCFWHGTFSTPLRFLCQVIEKFIDVEIYCGPSLAKFCSAEEVLYEREVWKP